MEKQNNLLITAFFTNQPDPQRGQYWKPDEAVLSPLINSLKGQKLLVLNDCFQDGVYGEVEYLKVEATINPYFQRWLSIYQYLRDHQEIDKVFCVDATDVEMLKSPFKHMGPYLYIGSENNTVGCGWMRRHHGSKYCRELFTRFGNETLINCGVFGGSRHLVLSFLDRLVKIYADNLADVSQGVDDSLGMTEMGIFNYLAYVEFPELIKTGSQVHTTFTKYETNEVSWFRHK